MTTYNRVTIVPVDTVCVVDGVPMTSVDMSSLPTNLHAMQWYGTWGEEEYMNRETRHMEPNVRITSLDAYTAVFASYQELLDEKHRAEEEAAMELTIIEV